MPTLGIAGARGPDVTGLGQVRPTEIDFNGDPTSVVTHIAWSSWGGAQAVGTGMSTYVAPDQETAQGTVQPMTVVAFDLGECDGVRAYQRVEWYAPQHGDSFDPGQYLDTCAPGGS